MGFVLTRKIDVFPAIVHVTRVNNCSLKALFVVGSFVCFLNSDAAKICPEMSRNFYCPEKW